MTDRDKEKVLLEELVKKCKEIIEPLYAAAGTDKKLEENCEDCKTYMFLKKLHSRFQRIAVNISEGKNLIAMYELGSSACSLYFFMKSNFEDDEE